MENSNILFLVSHQSYSNRNILKSRKGELLPVEVFGSINTVRQILNNNLNEQILRLPTGGAANVTDLNSDERKVDFRSAINFFMTEDEESFILKNDNFKALINSDFFDLKIMRELPYDENIVLNLDENGPIDWSLPLYEQLYEIFGLSESKINHFK